MIVLGADVSGHVGSQRHAVYIGFVLGTEEGINRVYRRIGIDHIHMNRMQDSKRNKIVDRLRFDHDVVGMCVYVERQKAIDSVLRDGSTCARPKRKVYSHFRYLLWKHMRDTIVPFAARHRCEVRDIEAQCDSDMRDTVLAWGMKAVAGSRAYELADVIAWCNGHGRAIKTCREMDIRDEICKDMRRDLLR